MTDATRRLSLFAGAILVLFLSWAFISARPWAAHSAAPPDPRVQALVQREQRLRHDAVLVRRLVEGRWRHYRIALRHRKVAIAKATALHHHALAVAAAAQRSAIQLSSVPSAAPGYSGTSSAPAVRIVTLPALTITRSS